MKSLFALGGVCLFAAAAAAQTPELGLPKEFSQIGGGAKATLVRVGPEADHAFLFYFDGVDHPLSGKVMMLEQTRSASHSDAKLYNAMMGGVDGVGFNDEKRTTKSGAGWVPFWTLHNVSPSILRMQPSATAGSVAASTDVWNEYRKQTGVADAGVSQADAAARVDAAFQAMQKGCGGGPAWSADWASFEKGKALGTAAAAATALAGIQDACADADYKAGVLKLKRLVFKSSGRASGFALEKKGAEVTMSLGLAPGNLRAQAKKALEESL